MSYQSLRKGRVSEKNRAYFITTVTHGREALFNDLYLARIVVKHRQYLNEKGVVDSLSWVIMPDHLHWLFQLKNIASLSAVMKQLKAGTARDINKVMDKRGPVWQKAFYDRAIRDNEDIQQVARYIVANPLRSRLVENIGDYPHWDATWL